MLSDTHTHTRVSLVDKTFPKILIQEIWGGDCVSLTCFHSLELHKEWPPEQECGPRLRAC